MSHNHNQDHGHDHGHSANKKALIVSLIITTVYMVIEVIGGLITNSLALLSDAGHMLSDSVSLGVGVLAFVMGEKAANYSKTYGYKRFEILAALFNGVTLVLIALYICYEAYQRFINPPEVASTGMLIVASIGLIVNIVVAWILMRGDTKENLNLRAAFLHVLGDLLGSIGAIVAALLIMVFGWGWADPLASVIVAILILISGWRVTRKSIHVLMEGKPENIDMDSVINSLEELPEVIGIHDLHIWSITSDKNAFSCHVVVNEGTSFEKSQQLLRTIEDKLAYHKINHVTVQLENQHHPHEGSIMCKVNDGEEHSQHHH
ncbi:cation diffusion facilitator family transporter [Pseudalkalibacillus hwajinpoensis]|uniref:cation diffusion facilitator family transporter n=1 Tax=Guptibacillus hwajinpoensis TaxID=208199 RepID=UPI001F54DEAC|nr:cation diffusion facilitator family transporter [Pseudalkalibacillus hwajinpoensis]